ncbi:GFA family protein [Ensifer soli]|uniref:GFA family protein n=1 Tax=Ciceribacter sp. sgz301302 TaxID=3342379 RepID=UPI0035B9F86C
MRVNGRCHCGRVTFSAEVDPEAVGVCHCTDCQSLTGSPFRVTALVPRAALRLTGGTPKLYRKVGDNGRGRRQYFCGDCGAPLFTAGEGDEADDCGIRWGAIEERAMLVPRGAIWCRSAVPWLGTIGSLPASDGD